MSMVLAGASRRRSFLHSRSAALALTLLAGLTIGRTAPAFAEDDGYLDLYGADFTAASGEKEKETKSDPLDGGPLFAVVSIADQRISVYGSAGLLARSSVSTGMRGHSTPTGVFSIVQKKRYHESNLYSNAPMPFMQRITWSGVALHQGHVPSYPASHGCIRLPAAFAPRLFRATSIGQRVIIAPSDTTPVEIAHATLPTPQLAPAPAPAPAVAAAGSDDMADAIVSIRKAVANDAMLEQVSLQDAPEPARTTLNPMEYARAMKIKATGDARAAAAANKQAMAHLARKNTALRMAVRKLSNAQDEARVAARKLAAAIRRLEDTDGKEAIGEANEARGEAEAALAEAQKQKDERVSKATEAKTQADAALAEAQKAAEAVRAAEAANTESQGEAALDVSVKAVDRRIAEAEEACHAADEELAEIVEEEARHVANATEAKSETDAALAEAEKAEETRIAKATEARGEAETADAEARKAVEEAKAAKDASQTEIEAVRKEVADAKAASRAASAAIEEASRRQKPLSVFISRKTGKLYVRQDFEPVFDAPITIRDPEREIGTHIFVSTHAAPDGAQLVWQVVSMPVSDAPARGEGKKKSKRKDGETVEAAIASPAPLSGPETALGALDRITIPEDVSRRLAELAWVGASVIVSDHGISGETGPTTDFIVLTRRH